MKVKPLFLRLMLISIAMIQSSKLSAKQLEKMGDSTSYTISGKLQGYDSGWAFIRFSDGLKGNKQADSARVSNGKFSFSGKITGVQAVLVGIRVKDKNGKLTASISYKGPFLLSSGNLNVEGGFDKPSSLKAFGGSAQDEYNLFIESISPLRSKLNAAIGNTYSTKKANKKRIDSLNTQIASSKQKIDDAVIAHVTTNPNSLVSAYIAQSELINSEPAIVKNAYSKLSADVKASLYGKELQKIFESKEASGLGKTTPSFLIPDVNGKLISLESAKGKFTLIDFWASWCGPCRAENPNLIGTYNRFQLKGLKIVSISMDTNKAYWLKAIGEDKLPWLQLSDLKGINSEVGKQYGITVLPMNFLIDKDGTIVGRDLKGTQLSKILERLL